MDRREFWATKSTEPVWHAVVFTHSELPAPFRLVANQFEPVTLGGFVHTPVPMSVRPPEQAGNAAPRMAITFPRQVVGREFKRQLRAIAATGSREPIVVTHNIYFGDPDTPQVTWTLYASDQDGVAFSKDAVQVTASDDNPMRRSVATIYDPSVFTGLALV